MDENCVRLGNYVGKGGIEVSAAAVYSNKCFEEFHRVYCE